jgi:hypothetical protein
VDKIASGLLSEAARIALAFWYVAEADGLVVGRKLRAWPSTALSLC